jgi:hypothetical protein
MKFKEVIKTAIGSAFSVLAFAMFMAGSVTFFSSNAMAQSCYMSQPPSGYSALSVPRSSKNIVGVYGKVSKRGDTIVWDFPVYSRVNASCIEMVVETVSSTGKLLMIKRFTNQSFSANTSVRYKFSYTIPMNQPSGSYQTYVDFYYMGQYVSGSYGFPRITLR